MDGRGRLESSNSLVAMNLFEELSHPTKKMDANDKKVEDVSIQEARGAASGVNTKTADEILVELTADPLLEITAEEVRHLVRKEFPATEKWPTAYDMDTAVLETGDVSPYRVGQWIERMGNDMVWHLEQIRRISHTFKGNQSENHEEIIFYKTSCGESYPLEAIRAPREGLVRQFGCRPLLWQQYAMLRMEQFVRFQDNHERDFQSVNFLDNADLLWDTWMDDPRNSDFKALFMSKPESAREKLKVHMLQPFSLITHMIHDREFWDFEGAECSVYQYNSFLGSGYVVSFLIITIQALVPFCMLVFAVRWSNRFPLFLASTNVINLEDGANGPTTDGNILPLNYTVLSTDLSSVFWTTWPIFCGMPVAFDQMYMNIIIFLVYVIRVVPQVVDAFYSHVGDKADTNSRLNSLRKISWLQGDDNLWMMLGYKLDRYLNSAYVALVNLIMLFILYITASTIDIILNALAIEFVISFDEEVAQSIWYDPDQRYLMASAIEILLRGELLLEPLDTNEVICETYDIDEEVYDREVGGPINDIKQALKDIEDPRYMNPKDKLWKASADVARELGRDDALQQFVEQRSFFGVMDQIFKPKYGGIFARYYNYYSWSRWDKVLFLPRAPKIGEISEFHGLNSLPQNIKRRKSFIARAMSVSKLMEKGRVEDDATSSMTTMQHRARYMNFDPDSVKSVAFRFVRSIVEVLNCDSMKQSLTTAFRRRYYHQVPCRFFDGVIEWFSFAFVCFVFPTALMLYLYLIFGCDQVV